MPGRVPAWQQNNDGCAFSALCLEKDRSPVLFDDISDDGQPQTAVGHVLRGHPGFEKSLGGLARQTGAGIADGDNDLRWVPVFARAATGGLDPQIAPAGHGFNGILEQIQKDLNQGIAVSRSGGQVFRKLAFEFNIRRSEQRWAEKTIQVDQYPVNVDRLLGGHR